MCEVMTTEEMEHINADRDIAALMQKRALEEQQKLDDTLKAEAAKYNMHVKRARQIAHQLSHLMLMFMGAGSAVSIFMLIESDIWAFAGAVVSTAFVTALFRVFHELSRRIK